MGAGRQMRQLGDSGDSGRVCHVKGGTQAATQSLSLRTGKGTGAPFGSASRSAGVEGSLRLEEENSLS